MKPPKGRVLVVDDDNLNRVKLTVHLQATGCEVQCATNGAEALEMLRGQPFDTMLLDLMMPVMDGFEVLEQIRADETLQHLPVIVVSGEEDLPSVVRCIEMGAADYLQKPFNAVLLRARVNACLEKKLARDRELELFSELQLRYEELQQLNATIREQADMLKELSTRDGLTGLYNRRYFDERAANAYSQAVRYGQCLAIVLADIDHFKRINDGFSHAAGDEVLRRVAAILRENTRESDLAARYGGEEFVIALPETPIPQAVAFCEKVRTLIESHPWHEIHPDLRVTMSLGVCDDTSGGSFEKMVAGADVQLYRAKEGGRNRVCCVE
jgi:diguanylate cyclase (GGDEF)-like protein